MYVSPFRQGDIVEFRAGTWMQMPQAMGAKRYDLHGLRASVHKADGEVLTLSLEPTNDLAHELTEALEKAVPFTQEDGHPVRMEDGAAVWEMLEECVDALCAGCCEVALRPEGEGGPIWRDAQGDILCSRCVPSLPPTVPPVGEHSLNLDTPTDIRVRLDKALTEAMGDFWAAVAKHFPEATSGDFPPDAHTTFEKAANTAMRDWYLLNGLPIPPVGARVRARRDIDRGRSFEVPKGWEGVVEDASLDHGVAVKFDRYIEGCEEWKNRVYWSDEEENLFDLVGDLEVI